VTRDPRSFSDPELDALLKQGVDAPDLTRDILNRVHRQRPFLSSRLFRAVRAGRSALAVGFLVGLVGVVLAQRYWPDQVILRSEPTPVNTFLTAAHEDTVRKIDAFPSVTTAMSRLGERSLEGRARATAQPQRADEHSHRHHLLRNERPHQRSMTRIRTDVDTTQLEIARGSGNLRIISLPRVTDEPLLLSSGEAASPTAVHGPIFLPIGRTFLTFPLPSGRSSAAGDFALHRDRAAQPDTSSARIP